MLAWSNDFAAITTTILILLTFYINSRNSIILKKCFILTFKNIVYTLFFYGTLLCLITKGYPIEVLQFNYFDVLTDQWWYFAPYSVETRVTDLKSLLIFLRFFDVPYLILYITFFRYLISKTKDNLIVLSIGLVLLSGGLVALVGGHLDEGYLAPFYCWAYMVIIGYLTFLLYKFYLKLNFNLKLILVSILIPISLLSSLVITNRRYREYNLYVESFKNQRFIFIDELGGFLAAEYKDYVELARISKDKKVIEEYWGIFSAIANTNSLWKVDSVIHSLGKQRDYSQNKIKESDIVITSSQKKGDLFLPEWGFTTNYWLYGELVHNWKPISSSPLTVVWLKDANREFKKVECINRETGFSINSERGYYEVKLNYKLNSPERNLLLARYTLLNDGIISVNPYKTETTIPVYVTDRIKDFNFTNIKNKKFKIRNCEALKIDIDLPGAIPDIKDADSK
jgi:hypothetical protein